MYRIAFCPLTVFFAIEVKRSKANKKLINDPKVTPSVFFASSTKKKCRQRENSHTYSHSHMRQKREELVKLRVRRVFLGVGKKTGQNGDKQNQVSYCIAKPYICHFFKDFLMEFFIENSQKINLNHAISQILSNFFQLWTQKIVC